MKTITPDQFIEELIKISNLPTDNVNEFINIFNNLRLMEIKPEENDRRYFKKIYTQYILSIYKLVGIGSRSDFFEYHNNLIHIKECSLNLIKLYSIIGKFTDYKTIAELNDVRVKLSYFINLIEKLKGCKIANNAFEDTSTDLYNFLFSIAGSKTIIELIMYKSKVLACCKYDIEYYKVKKD